MQKASRRTAWVVFLMGLFVLMGGCRTSTPKNDLTSPQQAERLGRGLKMGPWTTWPCADIVTALCANEAGLWCGTHGGLMFYDYRSGAYHWWTALNGLPSNHIQAIAAREGDVWVGTQEGIVRKKGDLWELVSMRDGLVNDSVGDIAIGPDRSVWVASGEYGGGVSVYDGSRWHAYKLGCLENMAINSRGSALVCDHNFNTAFMTEGTTGEGRKWQPVELKRVSLADFDPSREWTSLGGKVCAQTSKEWLHLDVPSIPVIGGAGAIAYDMERQEICRMESIGRTVLSAVPEEARPDRYKRPYKAVLACEGKELFIGGNQGLWQITSTEARRFSVGEYCNPPEVQELHELDDGTILVHDYNTYYTVSPREAAVRRLKDVPLSISDLTFPHIDLKRALIRRWIGGKPQEQQISILQTPEDKQRTVLSEVSFLMKDRTGKEWFSGDHGVAVLEGGVLRWVVKGDQWGGIRDACVSGDNIILGTNRGLALLDSLSEKASIIAAREKCIFSVHALKDTIWFGPSWEGIWTCDMQGGGVSKREVPGSRKDKHNAMVRDITSRGNTLFLATNGGVFQYDLLTETWRRWTVEFANAVLVDKKGDLWMGMRSGLFRYEFGDGSLGQVSPEHFTEDEKLIGALEEVDPHANVLARDQKRFGARALSGSCQEIKTVRVPEKNQKKSNP